MKKVTMQVMDWTVYEEFGHFKATPTENYNQMVENASKIIDIEGVNSLYDATETVKQILEKNNTVYCYSLDGLSGTAESLFKQARNGYIRSEEELQWVADILKQERKKEELLYVQVLIEIAREQHCEFFSVPQMKKDILDGQFLLLDDVRYNNDGSVKVSVMYDRDVFGEVADDTGNATFRIPVEKFMEMSQSDFEKFLNEIYFFNRVPDETECLEELTEE